MDRITTIAGDLARRGFGDPQRTAGTLADWLARSEDAPGCSFLVAELVASADPDLALAGLNRILQARPELFAQLVAEPAWARRLIRVLGASVAMNHQLGTHFLQINTLREAPRRRSQAELRADLLTAVGADPSDPQPVAQPSNGDALRWGNKRALLRIAGRDLTAEDPLTELTEVAGELADLADAVVEAALALARAEVAGWEKTRLGIVALGKTGAQELNYISDVDVLYLAEPATDEAGVELCSAGEAVTIAAKLAGAVARICSAHTAAGSIWQVDAALRPEGKAGPLVRTLASHEAYYAKWAKNWEFQAMLKARPMAGDVELAQQFVDMITPMVWTVAENDQFVSETQAMRQRVIALLPPKEAARQIKLGAGGLRDVEFSVQLIQLVHGRTDVRVRQRGTLVALANLIEYGYVGRADGKALAADYRFQRLLEHRVQLFRMRRTHLLPEDEVDLRRLARSVGLPGSKELLEGWRGSARRVLRLHQRLFYSPLLEAVARISSEEVRLTSYGAEVRLRALGYGDPKAALRHIEALSQGLTRQAEIQRQLLPAMLGWFAAGPNPDHGLLAFRQVSEAMGKTHWYLRALRDGDAMAERLAKILASSRYAVDLLMRAPQAAGMLDDQEALKPRSRADILAEMSASARRHANEDKAGEHIRAVRRRELLRLAMADLLGVIELPELGKALAELAGATLDAALEVAARGVEDVPQIAVIAMGRWGGRELSYASDADAMFMVEDSDDPDASRIATKVVARVRALLAKPGPDPALEVDVDLRPEGKGGPIVRSLASYLTYYERWSSTWEAQALLRADVGAGDRKVAEDFLARINDLRHPPEGLSRVQVNDIRKLKARMEAERMPRGSDPKRNTKLGAGGLSDVEWVVQLLQLQHGHRLVGLRTTTTLDALDAAAEAGLLTASDARALTDAWTMASKIRNAIMLLRGRASDAIPTDSRELSAVAEILGYHKGESSMLVEDYRRRARLARHVMDRVFWGLDD
ncbi:MAG: bifunctional [glutamine synthetase] adenylyltransferase/[glutamine synthetase]-adenylyl-L-tyrosine phosphorylase [Micropruina sp.]